MFPEEFNKISSRVKPLLAKAGVSHDPFFSTSGESRGFGSANETVELYLRSNEVKGLDEEAIESLGKQIEEVTSDLNLPTEVFPSIDNLQVVWRLN